MANWSYLNITDVPYNPSPNEYNVNPLFQGKYLVPIFWYLIFEADDFTIFEQVLECDSENKTVAYPAYATQRNTAIARLKTRRPYLQQYFSDNILNSLDLLIEKIENLESEHITIEAREISMMFAEPQHFADKLAAIHIRLNMVCSDEEIEYDRKDLIRAVLDAVLRHENEGICLYSETDQKFDADPAFFIGIPSSQASLQQ